MMFVHHRPPKKKPRKAQQMSHHQVALHDHAELSRMQAQAPKTQLTGRGMISADPLRSFELEANELCSWNFENFTCVCGMLDASP